MVPVEEFWPELCCRPCKPADPANASGKVIGEMLAILGATLGAIALGSFVGAAHADPLPAPAMSAPLSANADPYGVDLDWAGKWYAGGALSGLVHDDDGVDLGNGQAWVEKKDGWWQFAVQAGAYSLPSLGTSYIKSSLMPALTYGDVPVAYVKIAPLDDFSISAGKLPTLIGDEYTFTFENFDIQRGLLWNQEPAISNGVQANWSSGPFSLALSWNDGFYSKRLNWMSGSASYSFGEDTIAVIAGGNLGRNPGTLGFATPAINDGGIANVIYTHASGPWTISPYYQHVETRGGTSDGGAVLVNYALDAHWKLAGRVEYVSSSGGANMLIAGPGSSAWSLTFTPTYQYKVFFARLEGSFVRASDITPGFAYGSAFDRDSQANLFLETGVLL